LALSLFYGRDDYEWRCDYARSLDGEVNPMAIATEVLARIRELHATGKGPREISRIVGVGRTTTYRILARLGLDPHPVQRFRIWTPEQRARMSQSMRGNHNRAGANVTARPKPTARAKARVHAAPAPKTQTQTSFTISLRKPHAESLREWSETRPGAGTLDRFATELIERAILYFDEFRKKHPRKEQTLPFFASEPKAEVPKASDAWRTKINPVKVQRILFLSSEGLGASEIAQRVGVSRSSIHRIQSQRKRAEHVPASYRRRRGVITWGDSGGGAP
jgi:transposase